MEIGVQNIWAREEELQELEAVESLQEGAVLEVRVREAEMGREKPDREMESWM